MKGQDPTIRRKKDPKGNKITNYRALGRPKSCLLTHGLQATYKLEGLNVEVQNITSIVLRPKTSQILKSKTQGGPQRKARPNPPTKAHLK